jgi:hypothetical protein
MANIRVTCPTCESELELDEMFVGQEVECGSCGRVFVARQRSAPAGRTDGPIPGAGPPSNRRSEPKNRDEREERDERDEAPEERPRPRPLPPPPRRRERRRRDEEAAPEPPNRYEYDDDDDYGPPPERRASTGNGFATAALVLGLLSVGTVVLTLPFMCCCQFLPLWGTFPRALAATGSGAVGLRGDDNHKPIAIVGLVLGVLCLGFAALQLGFGFIPRPPAR